MQENTSALLVSHVTKHPQVKTRNDAKVAVVGYCTRIALVTIRAASVSPQIQRGT